ncbi:hypothetical protein WA026_009025 [Henosepilachna vigintioctopunctata]|uniref:Cytochrome P450 n=1 Tax=Henosepilachna vigintioctopunctata TaxID=420089 RepID=A0AAW1UPQ0_9CUCU
MEVLSTFNFLFISSILLLFLWMKHKYSYWEKRGVQCPYSHNYIFGHTKRLLLQKELFGVTYAKIYNCLKKKGLGFGGFYFFLKPIFLPVDLEIVKSIVQNEGNNFVDRGLYVNEEGDPISTNLFNLEGKKWRHLRAKLTPTFTSGKMKMMFKILTDSANGLQKIMEEEQGKIVNVKDILARFTTDVIGNCAFGLDCNCLENPESLFRKHGKAIISRNFIQNVKLLLILIFPELMKFLNTKIFSDDINDFMTKVVKDTVKYRESNNVTRNDFMHLLIQLKNRGRLVDDGKLLDEGMSSKENTITMDEVAAQGFVFFTAGFETSSSVMTFCLFELCQNKEIQDKVRKEIKEILGKYNGELSYEAVMDMTYMEKVIKETLRKYPPLPHLDRESTNDFKLPGTDVTLEKGTKIAISLIALHNDPDYFPNPEVFDPERFSEENVNSIPDFAYIPFGNGPRVCIGKRFGMMQTKVGLARLLQNFEFKLSPKTALPVEYDSSTFFLSVKGDIWLVPRKL